MTAEGLEGPLRALGAERFVSELRAAHARYGKLLGITEVKAPSKAEGSILPLLQAFTNALRPYVLKVSARADDEDPSSLELAAAQLEPLASWRTPPAKKASGNGAPPDVDATDAG